MLWEKYYTSTSNIYAFLLDKTADDVYPFMEHRGQTTATYLSIVY